jgi:hypothetical protein
VLREHVGQEGFDQQERAAQVDRKDAVPIFDGMLQQGLGGKGLGVVH